MLIAYVAAAAVPQATSIDRGSWFKPSDYPAAAMHEKIEGSVDFEVNVDASGNPSDCRITKSSGHDILDKVTCDVVRSRAHFKPALGSDGNRVAGHYSTTAIWRLDGAAGGMPPATPIDRPSWFKANDYPFEAMKNGIEGSVDFEVDVDATGNPTACRITSSSGHQILDQATCGVVRSRAHFRPARDSDGKPIGGRYSTKAIWRLSGPPTFYAAVILDYSADPDHPNCSAITSAPGVDGPTCEQLLGKAGPPPEISKSMTKIVVLYAAATGDLTPYQGEPEWGARLSHLVRDVYQLSVEPKPAACISIATEGMAAGHDACAGVPGARTISEADKKAAMKTRFEVSTFGVARPPTRSNGCRNGDSAAEAQACQ
jgi:TonB family protein